MIITYKYMVMANPIVCHFSTCPNCSTLPLGRVQNILAHLTLFSGSDLVLMFPQQLISAFWMSLCSFLTPILCILIQPLGRVQNILAHLTLLSGSDASPAADLSHLDVIVQLSYANTLHSDPAFGPCAKHPRPSDAAYWF